MDPPTIILFIKNASWNETSLWCTSYPIMRCNRLALKSELIGQGLKLVLFERQIVHPLQYLINGGKSFNFSSIFCFIYIHTLSFRTSKISFKFSIDNFMFTFFTIVCMGHHIHTVYSN